MSEQKALRYNEGKLRYDLLHPAALKGITQVLTFGATKYAERNWERGLKWSNIISSLKRHLAAIERGEDYDSETSLLHVDHLQCNAHFLSAHYHIFPELDDRPLKSFDKKVGLDLDGVLANFNKAAKEKYNISQEPHHWYYSYEFKKSSLWDELSKDKDFWMNIEPYFDGSELKFEPTCYVTHRPIPKEWCEEWLEKNNFPCMPVYVVDESKVDILVKKGVDIFIEDKYSNYLELNKEGIFTYLLTQPWNKKYDVGHRRINHVNDIVQ